MKTNRTSKQTGFTLIELMIVVAIIGVLSAIAVPAYKDYVSKSELASGFATLKSVITPAELYVQEKGSLSGASVTDLGVAADANNLGELSFGTGNSVIFTHENGAVNGTKFTYTRDVADGWSCEAEILPAAVSGAAPKGCKSI